MYLSRIRLNPTRIKTRQLLGSPQITHALVEGSRPPGAVDGDGRVLWRIDANGPDIELYVSSPWRPDFTGVVEQAGWPTAATWDTREYGAFLASLQAGQRWSFRVTANPTRVVSRGEGLRGKVVPHRTASHQIEWFGARAGGWGFDIASNSLGEAELVLVGRGSRAFPRRSGQLTDDGEGRPRGSRVAITQVTLIGALKVVDPDALRTALISGMGRARGYGCGLMTLAPPR
mgnify:CR=1 FL=1